MSVLPQKPFNYVRVAWQSALAAAFCLGLPAGLLLWLILYRQIQPNVLIDRAITFLQANGLNQIIVLVICSLLWSFLLGRISGYRPWWNIGWATALGIIAGWFSPLSNLDAWFGELDRFADVPFMEDGRRQPPMPERHSRTAVRA